MLQENTGRNSCEKLVKKKILEDQSQASAITHNQSFTDCERSSWMIFQFGGTNAVYYKCDIDVRFHMAVIQQKNETLSFL